MRASPRIVEKMHDKILEVIGAGHAQERAGGADLLTAIIGAEGHGGDHLDRAGCCPRRRCRGACT